MAYLRQAALEGSSECLGFSSMRCEGNQLVPCLCRTNFHSLKSSPSNTEESFTYEESLSLKIKLLNARRLYLKLNPTYIGIDLLNDSNQNTTLFRSSAEKRQFSKSSKKKQVAESRTRRPLQAFSEAM